MAGSENKVQRCYLGSFEAGPEIVKKKKKKIKAGSENKSSKGV